MCRDFYFFSKQVVWQRRNSDLHILIPTSGLGLYRNCHLNIVFLNGHRFVIHNDQTIGIYPLKIDTTEIARCAISYVDDYIERFPSYDALGNFNECDGNSFVNRNRLWKIQLKVPDRGTLRMKRRVHIGLILLGGWKWTSRGFVENRVVAGWSWEWCNPDPLCDSAITPIQVNNYYVTSQLLEIYSGDL